MAKRDREKLILRGLVLVLGVVLVLNVAGIGNLSGQGSGAAGCGGDDVTEDTEHKVGYDDPRADQVVPRNLTAEQKSLRSALTPELQYRLNEALSAETHEERQEAIRYYMRGAYDLPTSEQKASALSALSNLLVPATLKEEEKPTGNVQFEAEKVEQYLDKKFMSQIKVSAGDPMPKAFTSRSQLQAKSCNWWSAAWSFMSSGAEFGTWCGKGKPDNCNGGLCGPFDVSCSTHDNGRHSWDVWGFATINACQVDKDFADTRTCNGTTDSTGAGDCDKLNAANCLFSVLPCKRYESSTCWRWNSRWWGGYYSSYGCNEWNLHWVGGNYGNNNPCDGNCYD